MSGVRSDEAAIWLAAVTASVNLMFTLLGLYLVEKIGRRPLTIGSLLGKYITVLPFTKNYDLTKMKAFADDKINVIQVMILSVVG